MPRMTYYVLKQRAGWKIRYGDNEYTGYSTRAAAVQAAISIAEKWAKNGHDAEVQVEGADGNWTMEWPNDPNPFAPFR